VKTHQDGPMVQVWAALPIKMTGVAVARFGGWASLTTTQTRIVAGVERVCDSLTHMLFSLRI
jgi:hypothetical protein